MDIDKDTYCEQLTGVLNAHSEPAIKTLKSALARLPEATRRIDIGIHPGQEADGAFSIWLHLNGPDLYVLNKAIEGDRELFSVRHAAKGFSPNVPMFDHFNQPFCVSTAIVETAAKWVETLWLSIDNRATYPPATIRDAEEWCFSKRRPLG